MCSSTYLGVSDISQIYLGSWFLPQWPFSFLRTISAFVNLASGVSINDLRLDRQERKSWFPQIQPVRLSIHRLFLIVISFVSPRQSRYGLRSSNFPVAPISKTTSPSGNAEPWCRCRPSPSVQSTVVPW